MEDFDCSIKSEESSSSGCFECDICGATFATRDKLHDHLQSPALPDMTPAAAVLANDSGADVNSTTGKKILSTFKYIDEETGKQFKSLYVTQTVLLLVVEIVFE